MTQGMATNGVTDTQVKTEVDSGAGDAPERTVNHAKLLENGLHVKIANKLDDIFKTGTWAAGFVFVLDSVLRRGSRWLTCFFFPFVIFQVN